MELHAWWNGYEVVAAHSEEGARAVLLAWFRAQRMDDDEEYVKGEGWRRLAPERMVYDEDGGHRASIASILAESPEPRHLWSCEQ